MSIEDSATLATLLSDFGETWVAPGGAEFTAIFYGESTVVNNVRVEGPSVLARYVDIKDLRFDEDDVSIWRKAKGDRYVISDPIHDGREAFSHLPLRLDQ